MDLDRKVVFSLGGDLQLLRFGEPHFKWSKCIVYPERVVTLPTTTLPRPSWLGVGVLGIQKNLPCDIDIKPSVARGYWILNRVVPEDIRY